MRRASRQLTRRTFALRLEREGHAAVRHAASGGVWVSAALALVAWRAWYVGQPGGRQLLAGALGVLALVLVAQHRTRALRRARAGLECPTCRHVLVGADGRTTLATGRCPHCTAAVFGRDFDPAAAPAGGRRAVSGVLVGVDEPRERRTARSTTDFLCNSIFVAFALAAAAGTGGPRSAADLTRLEGVVRSAEEEQGRPGGWLRVEVESHDGTRRTLHRSVGWRPRGAAADWWSTAVPLAAGDTVVLSVHGSEIWEARRGATTVLSVARARDAIAWGYGIPVAFLLAWIAALVAAMLLEVRAARAERERAASRTWGVRRTPIVAHEVGRPREPRLTPGAVRRGAARR